MRAAAAVLVVGIAVAAAVWVAGYQDAHPGPVTGGIVGLAPTPGSSVAVYRSRPWWAGTPSGIIVGFAGLAAAVLISGMTKDRPRPT